jgi:hypothetical protein
MGTAEQPATVLDAMADHATPAMLAARSQLMNGTLERIERIVAFPEMNLEGFVIGVPAGVTDWHIITGLRAFQLSNAAHFSPPAICIAPPYGPSLFYTKHRDENIYTTRAHLHNLIYGASRKR